jgi:hypothetical protein
MECDMNRSEELIACLEFEILKRDARIDELEADTVKLKAAWDSSFNRALENGAVANAAVSDASVLRAELAALREQVPVAVVDCGDDEFFADILPDRSVVVGQKLYAAPVAKPQVVMPERMYDNRNYDYGWNACIDEITRLNAADQEGGQDE